MPLDEVADDLPLAAQRALAGLDPEQRAAAQAVRGPVCILAGAGTGKTRAITHRIAYAVAVGAVVPETVLAVTFTARAAGELRTRLRALGASGVQARTFHAAALRQLSYFAPQILGGPMPQVASNPIRWVSLAANRLRLRLDKTELRDLAGEIDWAKSSLVKPADYVAAAVRTNRGISFCPRHRRRSRGAGPSASSRLVRRRPREPAPARPTGPIPRASRRTCGCSRRSRT